MQTFIFLTCIAAWCALILAVYVLSDKASKSTIEQDLKNAMTMARWDIEREIKNEYNDELKNLKHGAEKLNIDKEEFIDDIVERIKRKQLR